METATPEHDAQVNQLASEIFHEHDEATRCVRKSLEHARAAGMKLNEVKHLVGHGNFQDWVQTHCSEKFSYRTAALYMRIAREWHRLENVQPVAHFSLREAVDWLAEREPKELGTLPWDARLLATTTQSACDQLIKEFGEFSLRLNGGKLYEAMGYVITDRSTLGEDDYEKIAAWALECRHRLDRCIEALRRRTAGLPALWEPVGPGLLAFLDGDGGERLFGKPSPKRIRKSDATPVP